MHNDKIKVIKDEKGRIIRKPVEDYLAYNAYIGYQELTYDNNDNVIEIKEYNFKGEIQTTESMTYDEYNNLLKSETHYTDSEYSYIQKNTYDEKQRLIQTQNIRPEPKEIDIQELAKEVGDNVSLDDVTGFDEETQEENNEKSFSFGNAEFEADIVKYEYDENDNCIRTSCFVKDELTAVLETEYENNRIKVKYGKNLNGEILETTKYKHISDFEEIITEYSSDNEIACTTHNFYDENKKLVKKLTKIYGETVQVTFKNDNWIESIYRDNNGKLKEYIVKNYDENGILTSVEIKGENEISYTSKNQKLFNTPVILNYEHYNTRFKLLVCFGVPIFLLIVLVAFGIGVFMFQEEILVSILCFLLDLIIIGAISFGFIKLYKSKDLFLRYGLNTANQQITFYNAILSKYGYLPMHLIPQNLETGDIISARSECDNDKQFVPIILNLNAIDSAELIKKKDNFADKLVLILNQTTVCAVPTTTKMLNTLEKLVPVKYKGLLSKFFINNLGACDNYLG